MEAIISHRQVPTWQKIKDIKIKKTILSRPTPIFKY